MELDYGLVWGYVSKTSAFSALSLGGIVSVVWAIALLVALYYVWSNGVLLNYIIYGILNLVFAIAGVVLAVIVGLVLLILGPLAILAAVVVATLPVLWYRSRLTDSWVMAILWVGATGIASVIGLSPLVDAFFFVNFADGDYW
ncbi:hypothetical protein [Geoglobus acetivorans]|uniref:Uncharacterized protein n=1 Tax=Geoglobus acetivorans TaxID=565033 RepID=A0A0A7GGI3_GEOAI|nr:hypothetical protein GACE_1007 [Geoglobus acetivorans]